MSLGADVLAMMSRAGTSVTVAGVTTQGLFDVAGRVAIRGPSGDVVGRRIAVRTRTGALPGLDVGAGMTVNGSEYVVHRVLQEHEGAVTVSLIGEKEGSPPTLVAEDLGSGLWRFSSASPADTINAATVTAPDPGEGTVQILAHSGSPVEREVVITTIAASYFEAQHGEQGAEDHEWVVDGVQTPGGVPFSPLSVRFTP